MLSYNPDVAWGSVILDEQVEFLLYWCLLSYFVTVFSDNFWMGSERCGACQYLMLSGKQGASCIWGARLRKSLSCYLAERQTYFPAGVTPSSFT